LRASGVDIPIHVFGCGGPKPGWSDIPQFEQLGPLGRPPNQLDLLGGMNIMRVPIEYQPNAIHVGRSNYGLYWGGQIVATFPDKGKAEKAGNLILRAFMQNGEVRKKCMEFAYRPPPRRRGPPSPGQPEVARPTES
jgi:hypothetical protein